MARRDTGPARKVRAQVITRDDGRCVRCGRTVVNLADPGRGPVDQYSIHHRRGRGVGGTNAVENLLLLCGTGTTGCHGDITSGSGDRFNGGYVVRQGEDPASMHVLYATWEGFEWYRLTPDGMREVA